MPKKHFHHNIEEPRSKLQGMFCLTAVLRSDRKEFCLILIRSLTPRQATGNALAVAVQVSFRFPSYLFKRFRTSPVITLGKK